MYYWYWEQYLCKGNLIQNDQVCEAQNIYINWRVLPCFGISIPITDLNLYNIYKFNSHIGDESSLRKQKPCTSELPWISMFLLFFRAYVSAGVIMCPQLILLVCLSVRWGQGYIVTRVTPATDRWLFFSWVLDSPLFLAVLSQEGCGARLVQIHLLYFEKKNNIFTLLVMGQQNRGVTSMKEQFITVHSFVPAYFFFSVFER